MSPGFPVPVIVPVGLFVRGKSIVGVGGTSRSVSTGTATDGSLGTLSGFGDPSGGLARGRAVADGVYMSKMFTLTY